MPLYPQAAEIVVAPAGSSKAVVADYICDGTADQVEINLAIARAAIIGGATVRLLPGTFTIAAPIVISAAQDNVWLRGSGAGATTIEGVLGDGVWHLHLNTLNQGDILRNFTLSDLTIDASGRSSNTLQGGGIIVQDGQGQIINLSIRDVELYGAALAQRCHGISFYYASGTAHDINQNIRIERVNIYNLVNATAFYGILMQHETDGFNISKIVIRANSAVSQAVYNMIAIYAGSRNGEISGCDCQVTGEGHSVYAISAGSNIRLHDNYSKMTIGVVGDEVTTFSEGGFEFESTSGHSSTPNNQTFDVQSINNRADVTSGPGFLVRTIGGATVPAYIHSLGDVAKNCQVGFLFQHGTNITLAGWKAPGCTTDVSRAAGVTGFGFDADGPCRVYGGTAPTTPVSSTTFVVGGTTTSGLYCPSEGGVWVANSAGSSFRQILRRTGASDASPNSVALRATSADCIRIDSSNRIALGASNNDPSLIDLNAGCVVIYNATASTGVTGVTMRAGAGQSTSAIMTVEKNDGTDIWSVNVNGVTVTTITATTCKLDANNYMTSDSGRLSFNANDGNAGMLFANTSYVAIYRNAIIVGVNTTPMIHLGAVDDAYVGLKRSGTTCHVRTGADGGWGNLEANKITANAGMSPAAITFAVLNAMTATATLGAYRITDRGNKWAYPDGTNWKFFVDDANIS